MNNNSKHSKCDFCQYFSGSACMVTPNSNYCSQATAEYNQWLLNQKRQQQKKKDRNKYDREGRWN